MAKDTAFFESPFFMSFIALVSGFMNAYTYFIRGGVFANNHTGNMSKLGIELFSGKINSTLDALFPIIALVLGAFLVSLLLEKKLVKSERTWRLVVLWLLIGCFTIVGFLPRTVPNRAVNFFMAFVSALMLSAFRTLNGMVCNSTICTGNLRSMGQLWASCVAYPDEKHLKTAAVYSAVVFLFPVGAGLGVFACRWLDYYSIHLASVPLIALFFLALNNGKNK